ncbi:MAG: hypothetical protein U1D55_12535 [Phycisphaerae bacterium]
MTATGGTAEAMTGSIARVTFYNPDKALKLRDLVTVAVTRGRRS